MLETALRAVTDLEKMGASEAESYIQNSIERVISLRGNTWNRRKKMDICIGLRTFTGNQKGFAAGTLPMCSLEEIEKASFVLSRRTAPDPSWGHLPFCKPVESPGGIYDRTLAALSEEPLMDKVQMMVDAAGRFGCAADCTVISRVEDVALANTHGVEGSYKSTKIDITFSCRYKGNEATSRWHSRNLDVDLEGFAAKTAEDVLHMKRSSKIDHTFTGESIFLPESLEYSLVPTIKWAVNGENFHSKRSRFAEKGVEVASEHLTVTDDGLLYGGVRSAPFDGEGTPMQKTDLITKGVFLNVVHTEYTANKYGAVSTGNALRSATREPYIDFTNFIIKPGRYPLEKLIDHVKEGVLLKDFTGDVDPSSGYFDGRSEGAYIKKGEIQYHCRNVHVQGNAFECLKNMLVGEDQECSHDGIYGVPILTSVKVIA